MKKLTNGMKTKFTVGSLLIALGIIYGDIGTGPLYVLKAVVGDRSITEDLVLGGIFCVFWTLLLSTCTPFHLTRNQH